MYVCHLEQHGIRCFVAYRDVPHGVVWAGAIVEALEHSRMMLVLFSKNFNDSSQVDREIELAAEQDIPILTFRLSDAAFTGAKKYYLTNLNWIDAFPNPERYFGSLKDNVCRLLGVDVVAGNSGATVRKVQGKTGEDVKTWLRDKVCGVNTLFRPISRWISNNRKACLWLAGACVVIVLTIMLWPDRSNRGYDVPAGKKRTYTVNGVSFAMVRVAGGTFTMGSSDGDSEANSDEKPAHEVSLSDYSIGETEVTQALWKAVMGSTPSYFKGDLQHPVEQVNWNDCQEFILKLNSLTGATFRLPTEAEWEYAARGGSRSRDYKYSGRNAIASVAWYGDNSSRTTHPVKGKSPNELGLYDMSGNVWEWCADWSDSYLSSSQTNPEGPSSGSYRVLRGGSWGSDAGRCRVMCRSCDDPLRKNGSRGFRLAQ